MHESAGVITRMDDSAAGDELAPLALSVEKVAGLLDCGVRFVWELVRTGELESFRLGRARRIPYSAVTDYVERLVAEERGLRERLSKVGAAA